MTKNLSEWLLSGVFVFGCRGEYGEKDQSVGEIVRVVLSKILNFSNIKLPSQTSQNSISR